LANCLLKLIGIDAFDHFTSWQERPSRARLEPTLGKAGVRNYPMEGMALMGSQSV
jgi:hypothetical protein